MKYFGKVAYKGDIATNYESDRITESIWQQEQDWLSAFLQKIPDGSILLDLPVGSGRFLDLYAAKEIKVFGYDISNDMISVSKQKLAGIKASHADIILKVADAEKIELEQNSVDYVVCFRLFHLIPFVVIKQIIKEFYRISNKQVIIEVFNSSLVSDQTSVVTKLKNVTSGFITKIKRIVSLSNADVEQTNPWLHIDNFTYSYNDILKEFKTAGFKNVIKETIDDSENPVTIFVLNK